MSIEGYDKDAVKLAAKALVSAVENFAGDASSTVEVRCKPLLDLFGGESDEDFVAGLTPKKRELFLLRVVRTHGVAFVRRFFGGLHSIVDLIISGEAYVPESAFEDEPSDTRDTPTKTANDGQAKTCLSFLRYVALCATASLEGRIEQKKGKEGHSSIQIVPEVYDVALQLHNTLLSIHDCGEEALATRNAILYFCEEWWLSNAPNRDSLISQVLPLLVLQASDPVDFRKSHIVKLLSFKDAFQVIDFINPSSDSLRALLLKVASNPLCLRLAEGRKFLASLFRDPELISDLHLAFRAQIPQAPKKILEAYGEIYFKAWCDAEDAAEEEAKEALEHQALQDLMHCAIHIAAPAMAKNILTVLAPIHMEKKSKRVADLLHRLYSPILWRSLSAANPIVRKNALGVMDQVFPLHDPNQSQMKSAIEKCTHALKTALQDIDPKVRIAASQAAANICVLFWDALSSADIRTVLKHLVLEHSSDVTSAAVREQALLATTKLLEIPQSHAVLRPLLPSLGNLVHDKKEKVRLAAVKLLLRIKHTRGIHFYHVVPVEHLSARFSEEAAHRDHTNPVNKQLTALLLSSYFPQGKDVTAGDQIQRTIAFLLSDPSGAASFYANLADYLEVESVAKFIVMLLACVKSAVQSDQAQQAKRIETKKKRRRGNAPPEDIDDSNAEKLSATNTDLMVGLVETIHTLLESVSDAINKPDNEPSKKLVHDRLREADLLNMLTHFEQKGYESQSSITSKRSHLDKNFRVCRAILRCVALLPKKVIPGVADFITDSLDALSRDENISASCALPHLSLLASWGLADDIASAMALSFESAMSDRLSFTLLSPSTQSGTSGKKGSPKGRRKKKYGQKPESCVPEFSARFAFEMLHIILSGNDACAREIRGRLLVSDKAMTVINSALFTALKFAERILSAQPVCDYPFHDMDVLLGCCEAYGRLALHRASREGEIQLTTELQKIVDWTTEHVSPVLTGATALVHTDLHGLDLSRISNVSDSLEIENTAGLMSPPKQRMNLGPRDCRISEDSASPIDLLAQLLMQSACLVVSEYLLIGGPVDDRFVSQLFGWVAILDQPTDSERHGKIKSQLLPGFIRLGLLLSKQSRNFTLLQKILLSFGGGIADETSLDMVKQTVKSLLPTGFQKESLFLTDLADTILVAGVSFLSSPRDEFQAVTSADDVLPRTWLGVVLESFVKNAKACEYLTDKLLSKILSHRGDFSNDVIFYGRCLSYLCNTMQSDTFTEKVVEELNTERPQFEEVRKMLEKIVHVGPQ